MKNSNENKIKAVAELLKFDNTKSLIIAADKVFTTFLDFNTSKELKEVHSGFQSKTNITESMFKTAYVVGTRVYVHYKADGLNFLKEEQIGSSLDNGGLYYVTCLDCGFIIDKKNCFDKHEQNRKVWRKMAWISLTSIYTN